jgi:hypothetical protein
MTYLATFYEDDLLYCLSLYGLSLRFSLMKTYSDKKKLSREYFWILIFGILKQIGVLKMVKGSFDFVLKINYLRG